MEIVQMFKYHVSVSQYQLNLSNLSMFLCQIEPCAAAHLRSDGCRGLLHDVILNCVHLNNLISSFDKCICEVS